VGLRRGFKAEANRVSLRVRAKLSLAQIDPIDPASVCKHFDINLIKLSELSIDATRFLQIDQSSFSAVTVPRGHRRAIVHNDSHGPVRQRSNICHELAHCFLGHECAPPLTADGDRTRDSEQEAEAHFLAGVLLIPDDAAKRIVLRGLGDTARNIYGISAEMLEYRLRVSGAIAIGRRVAAKRRSG
jgi:Zn-dependent peptidase ImmA (M78 family)